MPAEVASATAYFLSTSPPALALVGQGVRFPAGRWMRVADGIAAAWHVEQLVRELFPSLQPIPVPFWVLLTDFDVEEFERTTRSAG